MALAWAGHFNRVSISVAGAERLMDEYALTETQMGVVYSSYLLIYTLFMSPGGWLIDRYGARPLLSAMALSSGVLVAATALPGWGAWGPSWVLGGFLAVRGLLGLSSTPLHPGAARVVSQTFPPAARSAANGLVTAAALVGIASTYPLFGALIDAAGWRGAFAVCGVGTLGLGVVWRLFGGRESTCAAGGAAPPTSAPGEGAAGRQGALHVRNLVILTGSYAAAGYFHYLFFYWIQFYFERVLGLGTEQGRIAGMTANLAMAAGMLLGGWWTRTLQRRIGEWRGLVAVPVAGMLGGAVFSFSGIVVNSPEGILVCFSAAMASVGTAEGAFWTAATQTGGVRGGLSAAIFNTGGNVGGLLAPVATPLFASYFGWQAGIGLASFLCVLSAGLWLFLAPMEEARRRP
jgi:MFS family permease